MLLALLTVVVSAAGDIKPADASKPLFRILKFKTLHGDDHPKGIIGFNHPKEAATAEYLRRRLRLGEFE